jgi:hypothetical protein
MPSTYTFIASATVGAGGTANITFSSIPQTFTDLLVRLSLRSTGDVVNTSIRFNGSTSGYTMTYLTGVGNGNSSGRTSGETYFLTYGINPSSSTSNTFANTELYIPNYTGSVNKVMSMNALTENNATTAYISAVAHLWFNTAAITSVGISAYPWGGLNNLAQYSTATLYGIKNS